MKYYNMIYAGNEAWDEKHIGSEKTLNNNLEDYSVCCGKYVDNWNPDITLVCDNKRECVVPDWVSNVDGWKVVSQRFVDAVSHLENGNIQYLPIKIDAIQPQMNGKKYYVANVIKVIDAIDYENSDWFNMTAYRAVVRPALKKDKIGNNHIFIVKEDILSDRIFVSEEFKKAIQNANLLGFHFTPVKKLVE